MARLLFSCVLATVVGAGSAWAHHTVPGRVHPTVTIAQPVLADGKPLAAGTYELWISEDRPEVGAGAPSDAQRVVEFAQNGKVVAREIAEVFPTGSRQVVGTSGSSGAAKARVEMLKGGEFLRVSVNDADGRYLIHLPTGTTPAAPVAAPAQ
jgi:hypothetical protein